MYPDLTIVVNRDEVDKRRVIADANNDMLLTIGRVTWELEKQEHLYYQQLRKAEDALEDNRSVFELEIIPVTAEAELTTKACRDVLSYISDYSTALAECGSQIAHNHGDIDLSMYKIVDSTNERLLLNHSANDERLFGMDAEYVCIYPWYSYTTFINIMKRSSTSSIGWTDKCSHQRWRH